MWGILKGVNYAGLHSIFQHLFAGTQMQALKVLFPASVLLSLTTNVSERPLCVFLINYVALFFEKNILELDGIWSDVRKLDWVV